MDDVWTKTKETKETKQSKFTVSIGYSDEHGGAVIDWRFIAHSRSRVYPDSILGFPRNAINRRCEAVARSDGKDAARIGREQRMILLAQLILTLAVLFCASV